MDDGQIIMSGRRAKFDRPISTPTPRPLAVRATPSKGHGFSRAINSRAEGPAALPKAGVKPQAQS